MLDGVVTVVDPRSAEFCHRLIGKPEALAKLAGATKPAEARTNYDARRVEFALAESPHDYPLGDTFPHEANWDLYGGVSFTKGCYVGQEVVSRMQNKTVVRKRVVRVTGVALTSGAEIMHGAGIIGTIGTVAGDAALALVRLDRAAEARKKGETLICNGNAVAIDARAIAEYELSVANRPVIDL